MSPRPNTPSWHGDRLKKAHGQLYIYLYTKTGEKKKERRYERESRKEKGTVGREVTICLNV
jgi:hypothetical protein